MTAPAPDSADELKIGETARHAARVERRLQKLDGVTAAVNLATERATAYPAELTPEQLIEQVERPLHRGAPGRAAERLHR